MLWCSPMCVLMCVGQEVHFTLSSSSHNRTRIIFITNRTEQRRFLVNFLENWNYVQNVTSDHDQSNWIQRVNDVNSQLLKHGNFLLNSSHHTSTHNIMMMMMMLHVKEFHKHRFWFDSKKWKIFITFIGEV